MKQVYILAHDSYIETVPVGVFETEAQAEHFRDAAGAQEDGIYTIWRADVGFGLAVQRMSEKTFSGGRFVDPDEGWVPEEEEEWIDYVNEDEAGDGEAQR